jgi:hypothetical protein
VIVKIPRILSDVSAISAVNDIQKCRADTDLGYDFSDINFVFPFGTLLLAEKIREVSAERHRKRMNSRLVNTKSINEVPNDAIGYLKYFGFFKYIGTNIGSDYNRENTKSTYMPIYVITTDLLIKESGSRHWTESIENKCEKLASIISRNMQTTIQLRYCFREIMRNVFEHSNSESCSLMAQFYPSTNIVEITIADCGIGIVESMRNQFPNNTSNIEILEKALLPGMTSKYGINKDTKWGNTGFGLYILSEIGKSLGEFVVLSNGVYLKYYEQNKKVLIDRVNYKGTIVKLKVSLKDVDYFPNIVQGIVERGENKTLEIFGQKRKASGMSKKSGNTD